MLAWTNPKQSGIPQWGYLEALVEGDVSLPVLEMPVLSAVICFNSGKRGLFDVSQHCDLGPGPHTELYSYLGDANKVFLENIKSSASSTERMKTLRSIAKRYVDKESEEGPSYSSSASFSM